MSTASLRVLLLTRDSELAESFRALVVQFGHEARVHSNEEIARHEAATFLPQVVFIDQDSLGDEGGRLCAQVRAGPVQLTRLVAICGSDSYERLSEFRAVGFDFRFSRPLGASDLERFLTVSKAELVE